MKQIIINNISTSYYITQDGKCYNAKTAKYLKGQINKKNGYLAYTLTLPDGSKSKQYAHRLVALAYLEKDNKYKNKIIHIDKDKENNCVNNLEWAFPQQCLETHNPVFCFNKDRELIAEYANVASASKAVGVDPFII